MLEPRVALDLTWAQLDDHVGAVAAAIRCTGIPDIVIGVLRGGMVPAVLLAHRLGVRDVRGLSVTHTLSEQADSAKSDHPLVANPASLGDLDGDDVLLVDDVAGSGATLDTAATLIAARAGRVRRVALVVNTVNWERARQVAPQQQVPDYVGVTCAGWVRFPWEAR
jgi:hypoxanthine phosphoribosyltransferase